MIEQAEKIDHLKNLLNRGFAISFLKDFQEKHGTSFEEMDAAWGFAADYAPADVGEIVDDPDYEILQAGAAFKELQPLEQGEALPAFPLNVLSPFIREFIRAAADTVQAPVDMIGSIVLGMLEIACRGRYPIQLPNGHIENPCLYIIQIAPPSERKSGAIKVCAEPLLEFESEYNKTNGGSVNNSRSERKLLQGRIASAEQQAIKAVDATKRHEAISELQQLNNELSEFEDVEPLRLSGADVTPEKLGVLLKSQKGVFALVSAEGGTLFENINRYSDKGGLEIYLNGYSGDRTCYDRKNSDSIVIDKPTLNIIAPCQPYVVTDLFSDKQKVGRGLPSRFLYVICPTRVGSRTATANPLDKRIADNYRNLCRNILSCESEGTLTYDAGGFKVYSSFFDEIEPHLTPDTGELSNLADWAGKLPGQMTRLAGLLHCISAFEQGTDPLNEPINADEARAAVELARYFLAHAKAVYTEQAEPIATRNARYLWGRIKSIKSISKRELIRKTQGKQSFSLDDSLSVLVDRGYIRIEHSSTGKAGRPSETIFINPETKNIMTKLTLPTESDNAESGNMVTLLTKPEKVNLVTGITRGRI